MSPRTVFANTEAYQLEVSLSTSILVSRWLRSRSRPSRTGAVRFVASDMWKPYLKVIAERAGQALNVLDRFHLAKKLGEAVDKVRATEAKAMAAKGFDPVLKHSRWCFLKREENLTKSQTLKLADVLEYDLRTVRAYLLKQAFDHFWDYTSAGWAGWFLDKWCTRAMRSRLDPMKTFVGTLRHHRELLLNWVRAKGEISSGVVEGLNTNAKLAIRKARGFRTYDVMLHLRDRKMGLRRPLSTTSLGDCRSLNSPIDSVEEAKKCGVVDVPRRLRVSLERVEHELA